MKVTTGVNISSQKVAVMATYLKVVDLICEVVDARCPQSSSSPLVSRMILNKQHLLILNKADLADQKVTRTWLDFFNSRGKEAVALDAKNSRGMRDVWKLLNHRTVQLNEALQHKGRRQRGLRVAVLGIPNTGKSTFLNKLIGRRSVKTGDKPGLTKGAQWVHLSEGISVLDTPGIMSLKSISKEKRFKLAAVGSLEPQLYQPEEVCEQLLGFLKEFYPSCMEHSLKIPTTGDWSLDNIAMIKGFLVNNGLPDTQRASAFLLDLFRSGKLGHLSLEKPNLESLC